MSVPGVGITKTDFQTGVVAPSDDGVLAIVAASTVGVANVPTTCTSDGDAATQFGIGPLVEFASYQINTAKKPALLCKSGGSVAAAYGALTTTGGGSSVVTAGGTTPTDEFDVLVTFLAGGTIGASGITYQYNVSSGAPSSGASAIQSLGTANTIVIPNTGITLALAAGTILPGETVSFSTTRPKANAADLAAALAAIAATSAAWEAVLVDMDSDDTVVAALNTWISSMNAIGRFPQVFINARRKLFTESETTYQTALAAYAAAQRSIDVSFCGDGGDVVSTRNGVRQFRPASLIVAARVMSYGLGVDPAEVDLGPLPNVGIVDARGNSKYHDEFKNPTLDALGYTTLRTFPRRGGAYVNNGRLFSPQGSDYQFIQQGRTLNAACAIAFDLCTSQLSRGIAKNPKVGPNGERYIAEYEAQRIEALVNSAVRTRLTGQVDQFKFSVSRTDDISSNQGATLTCSLREVALAYVKQFNVTAGFAKAVS